MDITKCIICDGGDNLNTSMDITFNDKKYTIYLCDEHADDTTPKQAKAALSTKMEKLEEIIKQAEAMGLKIVNPSEQSKIIVVEQGSVPAPKADKRTVSKLPGFKGVSGAATGEGASVNLPGHASISVDNVMQQTVSDMKSQGKLNENVATPENYETEAQMLTTSTRGAIILPKKQSGNTGTTEIRVVQTDNRQLQDRFKSEADESLQTDQSILKSKKTYTDDAVPCTFCRGSGISRMGGVACPKCQGTGLLISE